MLIIKITNAELLILVSGHLDKYGILETRQEITVKLMPPRPSLLGTSIFIMVYSSFCRFKKG